MTADVLTTLNFNSLMSGISAGTTPPNTAYFNVRNFNATGNGTTDDTTAVNSTIAALNKASGVLYFPAGTYKITAPLTTITTNAMIMGDGGGDAMYNSVSSINYTSNNSSCFTLTNNFGKFTNISIQYTGAAAPAAGSAGITVTSANIHQKVDYSNILVGKFLINIDVQTGSNWYADNVISRDFTQYGWKIRNINNPDAGDWLISGCQFLGPVSGTTGLRIESSGGGKVSGCKFNSVTNGMSVAVEIESANTVDFLMTNCSVENFSQTGININGPWPGVVISGCQFGAFVNTPSSAISVINNPTTIVLGCAFIGTQWGSATALIVLTNSAAAVIGPNIVDSSIIIPIHT